MEDNHKNKLTKWLEILQQESWQLELIISGFAIFLVGSLFDPMVQWGLELRVAGGGFSNDVLINFPYVIVRGAWFFLLLNLICHVILRGLWIATIGLRYVSGDIEWEALNLNPKFDKYLRTKIGSYDDFIENLEKLCSIVFAFTFMIIFMLVSFGLWVLFFVVVIDFFINDFIHDCFSESVANAIGITLGLTIFISGVLYFIDFLTLGWLKRRKWLSKVYYPIYRFYSFITLAFLYQPIYYNLIDNKFGRKMARLLVPYVLSILIFASLHIHYHPYYPDDSYEKNVFQEWFYDDARDDLSNIISHASIPSKYVSNGFLEVFIAYRGQWFNESLLEICPDFKPIHEVGLNSSIVIGFNNGAQGDERLLASDTSLVCLNQLYRLKIEDTTFQEVSYRFFEHPSHEEKGVLTILDIDFINRGEHLLKIDYQSVSEDSLKWFNLCEIPFWKE